MVKENRPKIKKRLIATIVITLAVLLILYGITELLQYISNENIRTNIDETADFNFYPVDYSEDIFTDEEYLALIQDGMITYDDNISTIYTIDADDLNSYEAPVRLLVEMIGFAVNGDYEAYNSCFSEKYYESNTRKEKFTQQKIYSGNIKYLSSDTVTEEGVTYQVYEYELSYKIYKNNGTFRNDIGDGSRKQHVVITDRDGKALIDSVTAYQYK